MDTIVLSDDTTILLINGTFISRIIHKISFQHTNSTVVALWFQFFVAKSV